MLHCPQISSSTPANSGCRRFHSSVPSKLPPMMSSCDRDGGVLVVLPPRDPDHVAQGLVGRHPVVFFGALERVVSHRGVELMREAGGVLPERGDAGTWFTGSAVGKTAIPSAGGYGR